MTTPFFFSANSFGNTTATPRPSIFPPAVVRGIMSPDGGLSTVDTQDALDVFNMSIGETGSFTYDQSSQGLKSTQQLNVDWSDFSQHVFYNSAQVKVNAAVTKIIDGFPFDGTRKEYELFRDGLTGFEHYVLQQFPKNKSYLWFKGSTSSPDPVTEGTYITVLDRAGLSYPLLTPDPNGSSRLDPLSSSCTFQFWIWPATGSANSVVFERISGSHGFGCNITASNSSPSAELVFYVVSGSSNYAMSASVVVDKMTWSNVGFIWDRDTPELRGYLSGNLIGISSQNVDISSAPSVANLLIGSGSGMPAIGIAPTMTFSGALDEFRYFKTAVDESVLQQYLKTNIYPAYSFTSSSAVTAERALSNVPDSKLSVYLKLNEPASTSNALVIDSSGQGMHGYLNAYAFSTLGVRNYLTASLPSGQSPMVYERSGSCPVLFPDHPDVVAMKEALLEDAATYDTENPSHIVKLIPAQYLQYGKTLFAQETEEGNLNELSYGTTPRTAELGSTQTMLSVLYLWASFFDELKLYIDAFSTLRHVDYDSSNTTPDVFLQSLAAHYGIELPSIFVGANIDQFIDGTDFDPELIDSPLSLRDIQNTVWKRILINVNDIIKSKGTIHSIQSALAAVGIDSSNIFRFREHGGPTRTNLLQAQKNLRESRSEIASMIDFVSGGYFQSLALSASRVEPGIPSMSGAFITDSFGRNIGSTSVSDASLVSGSWTVEGIWKFAPSVSFPVSQSLMRLETSASNNTHNILCNLFVVSGSSQSGNQLILYAQPCSGANSPQPLTMSIAGLDMFDGQKWNVSFGRERADLVSDPSYVGVSSSWFLRAARQNMGEMVQIVNTASYFNDTAGAYCALQSTSSIQNIDNGCFLAFGNPESSITYNSSSLFLNATRSSSLDMFGMLGQIRFWSLALSEVEWREHVLNFKSLGVSNPLTNFNFVSSSSGSFQKLRCDWSTDQIVTQSAGDGSLELFDFSGNMLTASGSLFPASYRAIRPERYYYSFISPNYDESVTNRKVRVRSFTDPDEVNSSDNTELSLAPVTQLVGEQEPKDDAYFSIDFSIVDALNQDMMSMFANYDLINNAIGAPSTMFGQSYPDMDMLQEVYFNRLTNKLNIRGYFQFYKWFNTNIGGLIQQLIPFRTKFNGINYVIESHMLERGKVDYRFDDMYVRYADNNSPLRNNGAIALQQFRGLLRRY